MPFNCKTMNPFIIGFTVLRVPIAKVQLTVFQMEATTVSEFLSNGYVMAVVVLVSSIAQGSFSQASTHILNVEGIRLKTALQVILQGPILGHCHEIIIDGIALV